MRTHRASRRPRSPRAWASSSSCTPRSWSSTSSSCADTRASTRPTSAARVTSSRSRRWATDGPRDVLVLPHRRRLGCVLPARGVRLRGGDAAPIRSARRPRAGHCAANDRAGLGRERGLARHRGRRHVRSLPGLVRDDVLGLLPRASADPLLPHHPRRLVRMAVEERDARLAVDVDVGEHDRQLRRLAPVGNRALLSRLRHPDRLGRRLHRQPPGSLQPVHRLRGHRRRGAVRVPRRDVPHASNRGSAARPCRGRRQKARHPGRRPGCCVPRVDRRGGDGSQRQGSLPAGAARGSRNRRPRARCRLPVRREQRARVRDDGPRRRSHSWRRCS